MSSGRRPRAARDLLLLERLERDPHRRRPRQVVALAVPRRVDGMRRLLREREHQQPLRRGASSQIRAKWLCSERSTCSTAVSTSSGKAWCPDGTSCHTA